MEYKIKIQGLHMHFKTAVSMISKNSDDILLKVNYTSVIKCGCLYI
jgi:hypothetical protein